MRYIGIRHRVKKTKKGEARPTQIAIRENETMVRYDLEDEAAELDFKNGQFPVEYRAAEQDEDLSKFRERHIKWRKLKKDELPEDFPQNLIRREGKKEFYLATRVPTAFEGLRQGDRSAMLLGGSGDFFAYALAKRSLNIGADVQRIPAFEFIPYREDRPKDDDAAILAELVSRDTSKFYKVETRDVELIKLRIKLRDRIDAMKERIACEQRLRQRFTGLVFCSEGGEYEEGDLEKQFLATKANDEIFQALVREENKRNAELMRHVETLPTFQKVFNTVEGCGPMIASRIMAYVIDIRRFATEAKLKAYCGVHLKNYASCAVCQKTFDWMDCLFSDSFVSCPFCQSHESISSFREFPRRRNDETANWNDECRKALVILGDQFNKRPGSDWGQMLIRYKGWFRAVHPSVFITDKGKKRYTPAHIHKMGTWRTLTRFVEWTYSAWRDTDNGRPLPPLPFGPDMSMAVPVDPHEPIDFRRKRKDDIREEEIQDDSIPEASVDHDTNVEVMA